MVTNSDTGPCANCMLAGDEAPEVGEMRDGTGEPEAYLCDDCYHDWLRGQREPQQW